jgi:hypothetical protein
MVCLWINDNHPGTFETPVKFCFVVNQKHSSKLDLHFSSFSFIIYSGVKIHSVLNTFFEHIILIFVTNLMDKIL